MVITEDQTQKIIDQYEKYINPGIARLINFLGAVVEDKNEGCYVYDALGDKYLDCLSGHGVFNMGHRHPKIIEAVTEQLQKAPLSASKILINRKQAEAAEKLAKITPGDLTYSFFCNSGTEAVEGAVKLARAYTGKTQIISTENAFHGKSMGSLSATGRDAYKQPFFPLVPDFIHIPFGDIQAAEQAVNDRTAAIIVEPIQGEGGVIIPPKGYLKGLENLCRLKGIVFIVDEIQTGMGRCGRNFASEYDDVVPDILTTAKALGGGVMPAGAFISRPKVFGPFEENPFIHTTTFGGNPIACAAVSAAVDVLLESELAKNAEEVGNVLISELIKLSAEYPEQITEVRGKGLLIGVEMADEGKSGQLIYELEQRKVLVLQMLNNQKVVRIEPPLIFGQEEIDRFLTAFKESLITMKEN